MKTDKVYILPLFILLCLVQCSLFGTAVSQNCAWNADIDDLLGAPTPYFWATVMRTEHNGYQVFMEVTFAKHNNTPVGHFVTLGPINGIDPCNSTQQAGEMAENGWVLEHENKCSATYRFYRTLQDHIDDRNTAKIFNGGDFFTLKSEMKAVYFFSDKQSLRSFMAKKAPLSPCARIASKCFPLDSSKWS